MSASVSISPMHDALKQSPIPALRRLQVHESDETVVLSGTVTSYYLKQLAQETVLPLMGSRRLDNQIEVVRSNGASDD